MESEKLKEIQSQLNWGTMLHILMYLNNLKEIQPTLIQFQITKKTFLDFRFSAITCLLVRVYRTGENLVSYFYFSNISGLP